MAFSLCMARDLPVRRKWVAWCAFALLCLVTSFEWVIPPTTEVSSLELQGLTYVLVGVSGFALLGVSRSNRIRVAKWGWIGLVSTLFLGVPVILLDAVSGVIPSSSAAVLFAITPVVVVVAASAEWGVGEVKDLRALLVPAIAGVAGVLCVLPFDFPDSLHEWGAFVVVVIAVVLAGVSGVWFHQLSQGASIGEVTAIGGFSNAVLLLGWCGVRGMLVWKLTGLLGGGTIPILVQVVAVLLTLWLVREMEPIRLSARYLAIPLLTIVEGFIAMRPPLTLRLIFGIVLLSVGIWWILAAKTEGGDRIPSLT